MNHHQLYVLNMYSTGIQSQEEFENVLFKVNTSDMPPADLEKLMTDLKAWCDAERGRKSVLAEELGVSRQQVTNLLARRRKLTLHQFFAIQAFLKSQNAGKHKTR